MQGFSEPEAHLLPVCLPARLSVHRVWGLQSPIKRSSDKAARLACQSQTIKVVFGDCREKEKLSEGLKRCSTTQWPICSTALPLVWQRCSS